MSSRQSLLSVTIPLTEDVLTAAVPMAGGGATGSVPMTVEHQERDLWCWAAVATSVSRFYDANSSWTQCALANSELARADCCAPDTCNETHRLDTALQTTGNLDSWNEGAMLYAEICAAIMAQRPPCCRIAWDGDNGHFVAVVGYTDDGQGSGRLEVRDPLYGASSYEYDDFCRRYRINGIWTHSYATR
jgi:hypothetical protein